MSFHDFADIMIFTFRFSNYFAILRDPGSTGRDDAIFSGEKLAETTMPYFRAKVYPWVSEDTSSPARVG